MKHTKKMLLVPFQDGGNDPLVQSTPVELVPKELPVETVVTAKTNSIRKYAADRQRKMLNIILKLAKSGGYDEDGSFRTEKGKLDIVPLLIHALSPGRPLTGMSEFVQLLHRAGVQPEDVINLQVRDLLSNLKSTPAGTHVGVGTETSTDKSENTSPTSPPPLHVMLPHQTLRTTSPFPPPPPLQLMVPPTDPRVKASKRKREQSNADEADDVSATKRPAWDTTDSDGEN